MALPTRPAALDAPDDPLLVRGVRVIVEAIFAPSCAIAITSYLLKDDVAAIATRSDGSLRSGAGAGAEPILGVTVPNDGTHW